MDEEALADVAFLASSPNRVRALDALTDRSHERHELEEKVGISRMTAKRILDAFEARGWVRRGERGYGTTPLGDAIAAEFGGLLNTIGTMRTLATVREWLPVEAFDFDLRRFATAHITYTTKSDSIAPIRRGIARIGTAKTLYMVMASVAAEGLATQRDAVVENGQETEIVVSAGVLDVIAKDPSMRTHLREIIEAGGRVYRHEEVDYILFDCGDSAMIGLIDETGAPRGLIESNDEVVREWVRSTFEAHRAAAEPVAADELSRVTGE
ncbi:helix-turn-helix transcriptional regulator [Halobium palmae]|uniref:Helix-turn-helix transcriptional regulator n=1 Tax=Halobium palmae TaxID=1776492 RepID=A0ABD5RW44_9EURY